MFLSGDAMQWHKLTLNFESQNMSEAPSTFVDHRLDVTFTHESGATVKVPGYFAADGDAANSGATSGNVWKVHFNPPFTGDWTWEAAFRAGDDIAVSTAPGESAGYFDGDSGSFSVADSDKTGDDLRAKGVLEYDGGQYLSFAGTGETFLKSGVGSPENFLGYSGFDDTPDSHDYAPHLGDFNAGDPTWAGGKGEGIIGAVNYLAEQDVNSVYMMLMNIGGDGRDVSPWADDTLYNIKKNPGYVDLDERAQVFDVSKLDQWEIVFEHMQEKGLNLHLFLQETENDQLLNDGDLGPERMVFMREMVARFGHHNGIIWNLGEENTNSTSQITEHSEYLKSLDPYDHAVTLHTYPNQHSKYSAYEGTETLDALSFQTSNENQVPDLDKYLGGAEDAGRSVVAFLDEPGNASEGMAAEGDPGWQDNHANLRDTLWEFYAEGGSGAEWYYGYQTDGGQGGDLKMEDFSSRESAYEWAASAREFFEKLPLEDMRDGDPLTSGTETHGLALDGQVYAYYLPDGGSVSLNLSGQGGTYQVGWYDVISGGDFQAGSVETIDGGGVRSLGSPPSAPNGEWAVMIWNPQTFDFDIAAGGGSTGGGGTPTPPDDDPGDSGGSDDVQVTLRLVNTDTDQTIATFAAGDTLDPSVIGSKSVSIVADVSETVGSVRLTLGDWSQTENVAPYALFGDSNGDFAGAPNAPFGDAGDYSLKVELFANTNAAGKIDEQTTAFSVGASDGSGGGTPPDPEPTPPATDAMWVAQDGDVVMQAEKGVPTNPSDSGHANWKISDDLSGHSGDGYLHWDGPNLYGKPGSGALSYEFEVSEDGNYKLGLLGSRPKNGEASDLNNDFWVRMDGGPWKKVFYSGQRETWNWGEKFDVNHQKSPAAYDLDAGKHTLEIAGRSQDAYLDKIHLSLGSLNKDKGAPETLAPSEPDNPAPENLPPVIEETAFTVAEDGSLTISAGDVASDPEEQTLSIGIVSGPDHGTLSPNGAGALIYTPDDDYTGQDSAIVAVSDQSGNTTQVTLTLETTPENDAPEAGDDTGGAVMAGQPFELSSLLSNDSDPDGDTLTISAVSAVTPDFFEELIVSQDGTVTGSLSETATGEGTFEYTVTDGNGGMDTATVTITATAAEEPEEPEDPTPPDEPEEPEDPETPPAGDEPELVTAINIGSNTSYEAADGTVFDADDTGVGNRYSSNGAIDGTDDDTLYATEAWGPKGLTYAFDVENGDYDVTLHFAEIWSPANDAGVRVFDIAAEGQTVIDDLDVYSVAGARTAYTLDLDVTVEDGSLNLDFLKGVQNPKLSALEIWRDVEDISGEPPEEPPTGEPPAADMTELWLVDTDSDARLIELAEHTILHSSVAEGRDLSVASDIDETTLDAESAQLSLDGDAARTENVEPYALFGDIDRDYMGALDLEEGETREIAIDYYSEDNAAGDLLYSETLGLALQGDAMTGRAGEADLFAIDTGKLGAVSISGFEAGDTLAAVDGGAIDLGSGEAAGDDWIFDFGDGNVLTLEDYAAEQLARDTEEEDALAVLI